MNWVWGHLPPNSFLDKNMIKCSFCDNEAISSFPQIFGEPIISFCNNIDELEYMDSSFVHAQKARLLYSKYQRKYMSCCTAYARNLDKYDIFCPDCCHKLKRFGCTIAFNSFFEGEIDDNQCKNTNYLEANEMYTKIMEQYHDLLVSRGIKK